MKRIYQFSFGSMLIIALLLSFYYYFTTIKANTGNSSIEQYGDTIIENMRATTFDKDGKLANIIATPKLIHTNQDGSSYLIEPRITLFREDGEPWQIQSMHARSEEGTKKITFWDNVIVYQAPGLNNTETTIKTSKLVHYPDEDIAETDQFITIEQPGLFVESIGMRADLKEEIVNLLSHARGRYEQDN